MAYFHTTVLDEQIKALPTVDTASGSVATFDTDLTENLISCVCEIPDTGESVVNVIRCGKNILDFSNAAISGVNLWAYGDGNTYKYFKAGTYTLSYSGNVVLVYYTLQGGSNKGLTLSYSETRLKSTFTLETSGYYRFFFQKVGGISFDDVQEPQIEIGNQNTSFVTYNGTTSIVNFGSTILGGTVDVITGKIIDGSDVVSYAQNTVEIPTINGKNNVIADTGDTSVKYILSVGKAIS